MAGSYLRRPLSAGNGHGRGIKVVATATAGTTIHQAQNDATLVDVVTLYGYNSDSVQRTVTLEWGGTTAPDDNMKFDIPPGATIPLVSDLILRNNLVIGAFVVGGANVVSIFGFINRES